MSRKMVMNSYANADIGNYELFKDKFLLRLCNTKVGAIPYPHVKTTDDLAAVCYFNDTQDVVNVTEWMLDEWEVTFEDILAQARKNMHSVCVFENLEVLLRLQVVNVSLENGFSLDEAIDCAAEMIPNDNILYVLSNKTGNFGAGMLAVPEVLDMCMPEGQFFIFPHSVHALVITPFFNQTKEEITNIVRSVNEIGTPTDQLSDSVYVYNKGNLYTL